MNDEEYAKGCLEDAKKNGFTTEPDFTSWCGHEDCGIVNYLLKKQGELISKIVEDLDELVAWSNNYPKDSEIYIRIKRKREKYQAMLK